MYVQLELPIDQAAGQVMAAEVDRGWVHVSPPVAVVEEPPVVESDPPEPFGTWLLAQQDRRGLVGALAKAAKADAGFPKRGTADDVRSRLTSAGAEGDMFEAIDDAEAAWLAEC